MLQSQDLAVLVSLSAGNGLASGSGTFIDAAGMEHQLGSTGYYRNGDNRQDSSIDDAFESPMAGVRALAREEQHAELVALRLARREKERYWLQRGGHQFGGYHPGKNARQFPPTRELPRHLVSSEEEALTVAILRDFDQERMRLRILPIVYGYGFSSSAEGSLVGAHSSLAPTVRAERHGIRHLHSRDASQVSDSLPVRKSKEWYSNHSGSPRPSFPDNGQHHAYS